MLPHSLRSFGVFCAVAGGVWGGKRPHIWGENTKKISAKRKTSKNGRRVGEEGSFCSGEKKVVESYVAFSSFILSLRLLGHQ